MEDARAKFGDLVDRARLAGETTVITRYGKPVAAIVPFSESDTTAPDGAANVQPGSQNGR
jgi:prevent-host-death family protein